MISEEQYKKAKEVISQYESELAERNKILKKKMEQEQYEREQACGGHYFLEGGKWTSYSICQFCGKKI